MRAAATVVSSWISAFVVSSVASGRDPDPTRSGWRDADRTGNPWSSRCRTIRRPRKPVPPKTVMSPRWPAALWVRSSAMAVSRPVHRDDLSRASPTRRSGFTSACSGVPACQHLSASSPEHPRDRSIDPKGAKNVAVAKEFIKYAVQPKVLNEYLKAGLGRWMLPIPELVKSDPFWMKEDPHRTAYTQQTLLGPTIGLGAKADQDGGGAGVVAGGLGDL